MFFFSFRCSFRSQEDDECSNKTRPQWPPARLTRSATLPRKSRPVAAAGSVACSSGDGQSNQDKSAVKNKACPSSGSSGYNSLPRMNGGRRSGAGSAKNSPPSETSYSKKAAAAAAATGEEDAAKAAACGPDARTAGQGSNFDSSYSCDEISVNDSSITLTTVTPPVKAKTAADLRREYFRGLSKYGPTASGSGSCGGTGAARDRQQQQHQQKQYFGRGEKQTSVVGTSLHQYFDHACKIK